MLRTTITDQILTRIGGVTRSEYGRILLLIAHEHYDKNAPCTEDELLEETEARFRQEITRRLR